MRSLEEYQAEIFRRSKARIEKRKKITIRIISLCVPFCLCIGAWLLWRQPEKPAYGSQAEVFTEMEAPMAADVPESTMYARMETPKGTVYTVTEPASITALEDMLLTCNRYPISADNSAITDQKAEHSPDSGCHITLITSDGTEHSWILQENALTHCQTGEIFTITEDDMTRLYEIFGITGD